MAAPSIWEALAGREPGRPLGPADPDLYDAVVERLNPARARPRLLDGIETAEHTSVRGAPYVMLRSAGDDPAYLRLDPAELLLARRMDGSRTVAALVGDFARIGGRLAPAQVIRVVADLAANRMLADLPVDAFRPLRAMGRRSAGQRFRHRLASVLRGRPVATFSVGRPVDVLYRLGGRLLFTRAGAALIGIVAVAGAAVFARRWVDGTEAVFVAGESHVLGGLALLGLNVLCVAAHELGHGLAARHAGRRVSTGGVMLYFGIPSVFVDTSDVWMAGRRERLVTAAAGTVAAIGLAGALNLASLVVPELSAAAFKLGFLWYLNAVFNLNPLLALDGYHVLMDWLDIPNLRSNGLAFAAARLRRRQLGWAGLSGEDRLYAMYGTAAALWLVVTLGLGIRLYKDRIDGLGAALWQEGIGGRAGVALIVLLLVAPFAGPVIRWAGSAARAASEASRRRHGRDLADRLRILVGTALGSLDPALLTDIARRSAWIHPRAGSLVSLPGSAAVVAAGVLEGIGTGDPTGVVRRRALAGDVIGSVEADEDVGGWRAGWHARLLALPADTDVDDGGVRWRLPLPASDVRLSGAHLGGISPALVWPAGAVGPPDDGSADRRLLQRLRWLVLLLVGLAFLAVVAAFPAGTSWTELRGGQVLAIVELGTATVDRPDGPITLRSGERIALSPSHRISVGGAQQISVGGAQATPSEGGRVALVFHGGATGWLCEGASARLVAASTSEGNPSRPAASMAVLGGIVVVSPASSSPRFADLVLTVTPADVATSNGQAADDGGYLRLIEPGGTVASDRICEPVPGTIAVGTSPVPSGSPGTAASHGVSPAPAISSAPGGSGDPVPTITALDGLSPTPGAAASASAMTPAPDAPSSPPADGTTRTVLPTPRPTPTPAPRSTPTVAPTATPAPPPTPAPTIAPGFSLACSPDALQAPPGAATTSTCTVTSIGTFASGVKLVCSGLGKVAGCTFTPSVVTPGAGKHGSATLEIRVSATAPAGCYPFSVVGTSGSLSTNDRLVLDVPSSRGASC